MPVPHKITKRLAQLYSVSTTALWTYDYFLTVGDEVGVYRWKRPGRGLTAAYSSVTHGK